MDANLNFLLYEKGMVIGNLESYTGLDVTSWDSMSYEGFLDWQPNCAAIISTEELSSFAEVDIFPNPTMDIVNIDNHSSDPLNFYLINSLGQIINQGSLKANALETFNLSKWPNGVYYLRLEDGIRQKSQKLLKLLFIRE